MKGLLKRIRGILGMGIAWGGAGALTGMLIEVVNGLWTNPLGAMMDMWPVALGLPGFLAGIGFASALAVMGRTHRFDQLSYTKFAMMGAVGGLVVAALPWPLVALGLIPVGFNLWPVVPAIIVPFALVGAVVAPGTLAIARFAEERELRTSEVFSEVGDGDAGTLPKAD